MGRLSQIFRDVVDAVANALSIVTCGLIGGHRRGGFGRRGVYV